jgi:hypothetical protein
MAEVWSLKVLMALSVCTSQSFTVLSSLPETSRAPSSENARESTMSVWPERKLWLLPVIMSRSTTVLDPNATAMIFAEYAKADGSPLTEIVLEHVFHRSGSPMSTITF